MPWCEPCGKYRAPNALMADGTCPRCNTQVEQSELAAELAVDRRAASEQGRTVAGQPAEAAESVKIPWHFWVMVAAAGIYLGWRVIQGVGSLF